MAFYTFDGNAQDSSGNGHHAQSVFDAVLTEGRHGIENTAYLYNGASIIVIPDAPEFRGGGFPIAVSVWFNTARLSSVNPLVTKYLNASSKDWGIRVDNGFLTFSSENGSDDDVDYICRQDIGTVTSNEWHQAVFVAIEPYIYLYLDGVLVGSCDDFIGEWVATENDIEIGQISYKSEFSFIGSIDDVMIWNRELSAQEVLDLFNFAK